jgi:hypothetical protein
MIEEKQKVICDVCNREITKERMKERKGIESILAFFLGVSTKYYYGDRKCDICVMCMNSYEEWLKSRRW